MSCPLATERVWVESSRYHDAEKDYFERLSKPLKDKNSNGSAHESNNSFIVKIEAIECGRQLSSNESEIPITGKSKKSKKSKARLSGSSVSSQTDNGRYFNKAEFDKEKQNSGSIDVLNKDILHPCNEELKTKKKKKNTSKDILEKTHEKTEKKDKFEKQKSILILPEQQENHHKLNLKIKSPVSGQCALVSEIAKARQHIKNSLERMDGIAALAASPVPNNEIAERLSNLEKENIKLNQTLESLRILCIESQSKIKVLESHLTLGNFKQATKNELCSSISVKIKDDRENDDDGVDLFASDEEENQVVVKIREQRLAAYNAKKAKKPALIAKSSVLLDVKPWDDETDLKEMEKKIRKIEIDGLLWGASKLVPVAFGIKKLVINCIVEDEKVSIDWLTEEIEKIEEYVQSVDVAAFNKI